MKTTAQRYALKVNNLIVNVKEFKASRRIRIIVHRDGSVVLTCPPRTSKQNLLGFINMNLNWILNTVNKIVKVSPLKTNNIEHYNTKKRTLQLQTTDENILHCVFTDDKIIIFYPKSVEVSNPQVQDFIKKAIRKALKSEALEYVPKRIQQLAVQNNLHFSELSIGSAVSRWGCCSNKGKIIISCYVMLLRDELIDYVLLHELCHLVHFNHSAAFHKKLNEMLPCHNEQQLVNEIKKISIYNQN